jgi:hypothetical protein
LHCNPGIFTLRLHHFQQDLRRRNTVRLFKLGPTGDEIIMLTDEYIRFARGGRLTVKGSHPATEKFLSCLPKCNGVSVTSQDVMRMTGMAEEAVASLVRHGLLLDRDAKSYWIAVPNAAGFVKELLRGREELQKIIKRSKFKELLKRDLLKRKCKWSKLGMKYHIADLVGSGQADAIHTTSGPLIRLVVLP